MSSSNSQVRIFPDNNYIPKFSKYRVLKTLSFWQLSIEEILRNFEKSEKVRTHFWCPNHLLFLISLLFSYIKFYLYLYLKGEDSTFLTVWKSLLSYCCFRRYSSSNTKFHFPDLVTFDPMNLSLIIIFQNSARQINSETPLLSITIKNYVKDNYVRSKVLTGIFVLRSPFSLKIYNSVKLQPLWKFLGSKNIYSSSALR